MKSLACTGAISAALRVFAMAGVISGTAFGQSPPAKDAVVLLDQGWSTQDRLKYYFTSQGSAVIPYDLFLNLEEAKSDELFRSDRISAAFGLITERADARYNPDGLPIGVTKTTVPEGRWKGDWVGLTCAMCHNAQLNYKGSKIRIDGGVNNRIEFTGYIAALDEALAAAVAGPEKFDRLAKRLNQEDAAAKADLRKRLETVAGQVHQYRTRGSATPFPSGPGRMDALTQIHNRVLGAALGVPENWVANLAPTKPPFLWNAPQSAWVQWTGFAMDPLGRNSGESLGVFIKVDLTSKTPELGLFDSTMDLNGQNEIEELLRKLAPPRWPEELLGKIDREKAAAGRKLFVENCAKCHSTWPHRWSEPKLQGKRFIENALVSHDLMGTDPMQFNATQFDPKPAYIAGRMSEYLAPPYQGAAIAPEGVIMKALSTRTREKALSKLKWTKEQLEDATGFRDPSEPGPPQPVYKAGPRDGIWATPPYLHNGSVPSLYELLTPAKQRSKTFFIGSEFDPVKVGVDTTGNSGKFLFDTTLVGNSNAGHSFETGPSGKGVIGRLLRDDERWALIEYLKSIPTEPRQVAPFGGPKDPVKAWEDKTFFHMLDKTGYDGKYKSAEPPKNVEAGISPTPALGQEGVVSGEAEFIEAITKQTLDRLKAQYPAGKGEVRRDAHPKAHGLVRAEFIVADDLPKELRYGIFAKAKKYDALIRFSAGGLDMQPDTVQQGRGMAIKLLDVQGTKLLEDERDAQTQDFVMINFPTFFVRNLKDYEDFHLASADGTISKFLLTHPQEAEVAYRIGHQTFHNPFQVRYWSQTPYKLGPNAIKFSARPITEHSNAKPETTGPDYLREAMIKQIGSADVEYEFLVQVQTDAVKMPVEDPLVEWTEADSPFRRVALIRIPKQDISGTENLKIAEQLSFTPWHALPEHQPLGSINRARRVIYEAVSEFRHKSNNSPRREPTELPK